MRGGDEETAEVRRQRSEVRSLTSLRLSLTNICRLAIFFAFYNEI